MRRLSWLRNFLSRRPASQKRQTPRARSARLCLELLEDRNLLSNGQWVAVFGGLTPATTFDTQAQNGQNLLQASGISTSSVQVVKALDLSGSFAVQTPLDVDQTTLTSELQVVPGFRYVQDPQQNQGVTDSPGSPLDDATTHQNADDLISAQDLKPNANGPSTGGSVTTPSGTNDLLTNNNNGASGNYAFTHSETTTIAFGSTVLVGFNDSGEYPLSGNKFTGFSRSTDGGTTFTDGGALPFNPNGDAGDPVLARDNTTGRTYFATLQYSGSGVDVFHSDDGGVTWSAPVQGAPGKTGFQDKEWITVDNFAGSGNGNVYLVARDFGSGNGIYFYRSTNQGATFGPNGGTFITFGDQGAFVTVSPDHAVEVYWWAGSTLQMRKSTDQGLTFGAPVTVASGLIGGTNGDLNLTGERQGTAFYSYFRSNEFPHAAVNPVNGNLYVTYNNHGAGSDKADVFFVQSTDGGATWSAPVKVNDDTTTTDQWQPTIAVSPDGSKVGIFYYSRQEDPSGNNLFKYYGRIGTISGSTVTFSPSFAVSDTASLPEFGRDGYVNSYYMGDYNTAFGAPGTFDVSWSDNRYNYAGGFQSQKEPDVFFKQIALGLQVTTTTPAVGSLITTQPTTFTVNVTDPIDPASLDPSDFTVNGIAATSDSYTAGSTTITFTFASTPVTAEGLQTMQIAAGAFTRASDGNPVGPFDGTFRYTAQQLAVVSTNPGVGGTFTIPPATQTYDVNFNRPFDPSTVHPTSLVLSGVPGAFVSGVTYLNGNTTARFTLGGLTTDEPGTLTASIAAGAIADAVGNPNVGFSGSYVVDIPTQAFPTPLTAKDPAGSLIYDPSASDTINYAGDTETYTLAVDPGQTISVLVTANSPGLQPTVTVFDPSNTNLGTATAAVAGQNALLQTVATTTGGTYSIAVGGANSTTGSFTVRVTLNAALENEGILASASNNTLATAQDINSSFVTLATPQASASRGAVLGQTDNAGYTAAGVSSTFEPITTGTLITGLQNADDNSVSIPVGFSFPFYGTNNTSICVSSNGLLTFGSGNSAYSNADLTSNPSQAAIAPYWDDLYVHSPSGNVYYQVSGTGSNQHLTIEWYNVQYYYTSSPITFEAQLYADGRIQFNYQNLVGGVFNDNGRSATVGIKAAGTQGSDRLLLDYNNGPNAYVGSNQSTLISPPNPTPDYYSFSLNAGDTATVAVTGQGAGNLNVDLRDGSDSVLATGVSGATNLTKVISNFTAPTTATYYVRLSGDSNVPYSVVVTRNGAFDTEANDSFATAQSINGLQGALGHVGGGGGTTRVAVLSESYEYGPYVAAELNTHSNLHATVVNSFGLDTAAKLANYDVVVIGDPYTTITPAAASAIHTWEQNGLGGVVATAWTYFDSYYYSSAALPDLEAIVPINISSLYNRVVNYSPSSPVVITNGSHPITQGISTFGAPPYYGETSLAGTVAGATTLGTQNGLAAIVYDSVGSGKSVWLSPDYFYTPPAINGSDADRLLAQAVAWAAPPGDTADWYSINVADTAHALRLETSTPADGPGEFVNTLDPHIQLYDPSGNLVASGTNMVDGRNEYIQYTPLATGSYRVRVTADNSTTGEYFLTKNFIPVANPLTLNTCTDTKGTVTVNGTFTDPDALDTHTVTLAWGDGSANTVLTLAAGVSSYSASHAYVPSSSTFAAVDTLTATVADNHGASSSVSDHVAIAAGGGAYTLQLSSGGSDVQIYRGSTGGTPIVDQPAGSLDLAIFVGAGSLNVNYSNGDPMPTFGVGLVANPSLADTLTVSNGTFDSTTYSYTNATNGDITLVQGAITRSICYQAIDQVTTTGSTASATFNLPNGGSDAVLQAAGTSLTLNPYDGTFTPTRFVKPTSALTINGGTGTDIVEIVGGNLTLPSTTTMNVQTTEISMNPTAVLTVGTLVVEGNLDIRTVGQINGSAVQVYGNVSSEDTSLAGTAPVSLVGSANQTITTSGQLANLDVSKSGGTVTLSSEVDVTGNLTGSGGTFAGSGYLTLLGGTSTINVGSGVKLDNLEINKNTGANVTLLSDLTVQGNLKVTSVNKLDLGSYHLTVDGDMTVGDNVLVSFTIDVHTPPTSAPLYVGGTLTFGFGDTLKLDTSGSTGASVGGNYQLVSAGNIVAFAGVGLNLGSGITDLYQDPAKKTLYFDLA